MTVSRARAAIVLGTVLLWAVSPAMACLVAGHAGMPGLRSGCHEVAEHCHDSLVPVTNACCRALPQAVIVQADLPSRETATAALALHDVPTPPVRGVPLQSVVFFGSPPGELLSSQSSVLRI